MSVSGLEIADVLEALAGHGFHYVANTSDNRLLLEGKLVTDEGEHECDLVVDKDFSVPPTIFLRTIPAKLRPIAPHINEGGSLCYLSKSSVAINVFDPIGQMLACVDRASFVLNEILAGRVLDDLAEEFFACWSTSWMNCYFDVADRNSNSARGYLNQEVEPFQCIVTDDLQRTRQKLQVPSTTKLTMAIPVTIVKTRADPRPSLKTWPITTVGELLNWQKTLDPRAAKRLEEAITHLVNGGYLTAAVVIVAPRFLYAFTLKSRSPKGNHAIPKHQKATNGIRDKWVIPMNVYRIDDRYVTQRNIPSMKTLAGKNISLIGCGTIGGYLAEMLVKAGAGTDGGQLVLVDNDFLSSGNLGRHRLGFGYLGRNKAQAMQLELQKIVPGVSVKIFQLNVREVNLKGSDLVIDATGEEAIGNVLTHKYVKKSAMMSVWIAGPGVAVRAVMKSKPEHACPHCLSLHGKEGKYLPTVEVIDQIYAGQGCEQEYVPFAGTASIQAACLAAELAFDWIGGRLKENVRTRILAPNFTSGPSRLVVGRFDGCPACNM